MKLKKKIAKALTDSAVRIAIKAAGQVSICGTYQPKEPAAVQKLKK